MSKRYIHQPPRGGVNIHLTKRQAKKVLRALDGPSVTDPDLTAVYELLREVLEEEK